MRIVNLAALALTFPLLSQLAAQDSMEGMSGPNFLKNGRFEETVTVAYPWTGVDEQGYLRKSVQERGVNIFVEKSNQFSYAYLGNSASFTDLDGDALPDLVAPDGAGFFWCWKNIGTPGDPRFGAGEVMPLLVDNERSRFAPIFEANSTKKAELSKAQQTEKERVDKKREELKQRLQKQNSRRSQVDKIPDTQIEETLEKDLPYSWNVTKSVQPELTTASLNGFRQLRAVAAPYDFDKNGTPDFLVGDAQGTLYVARNLGTPKSPNFRTYTKSSDRIVLKFMPRTDPATKRTTFEAVDFLNYATPFVCDWDQNGDADFLLGEGTYSVNTVRLFLNPVRGSLATGTGPKEIALMIGETRTFLAPFAWDWDGDGSLDLFVNDSEGLLTVYPNPGGRYSTGTFEMTEFHALTFEGKEETSFLAFCCPQPCDWNNDGVMDLLWSDPLGRIFYAIGQGRGSTAFAPPIAVRSELGDRRRSLVLPKEVSFCGVPTGLHSAKGGTADSQRYITQTSQGAENQGGWPKHMHSFYGLMPSWDPNLWREESKKTHPQYNVPKPVASWAVAPVPYEVFHVLTESGPGKGNTFLQTWHNPLENLIFKQPRDQMTQFGQGISYSFFVRNDQPVDQNLRVSFYMKLEGSFQRLDVKANTVFISDDNSGVIGGGGFTGKTLFNPPIGQWFQYEFVLSKGRYRRVPAPLEIRLLGRGSVKIRDVAFSTTEDSPSEKP